MKPNQITIALDGPSGAGKSTVAGLLAKKTGYFASRYRRDVSGGWA